MKLFILFHGRYPSEQAAAIFATESARSFGVHAEVTLVVPRRLGRGPRADIPKEIRVVYLPTLDLFWLPIISKLAFPISYITFSLSSFVYFFCKLSSEDIVLTNEALPALCASALSKNVVFEVHDFPERFHGFYSRVFARMRLLIATNAWKAEKLQSIFLLGKDTIVVERNAVDISQFKEQDRNEARRALNLPTDTAIAVYTGHLYGWKGVDTLAQAARLMPGVSVYFVGGVPRDIERFTEAYKDISNITIVGHRPHAEMPHWQAAADVLVLPNTGKEEISAHYTSPMKLFEYMASGRPIVASRLPSITEVLPSDAGFFAEPDSAESFAQTIQSVLQNLVQAHAYAQRALKIVSEYSWKKRAQRLWTHITQRELGKESFLAVRSWFFVPLLYAAALLIVFAPFLFGGNIFSGSDVTVYYYQAFDFYHTALRTGQSFLWNPYIFSGFPMYLSQVAGYFDPLNYLIFQYLGGFDGVHVRLYIDYFLLLIFSYAAGRAWGLSRMAAFCIGLAYLLPFNETFISNPLFANSAFLMPLLVWVFGHVRKGEGWSFLWAVGAGVATGFAFLGGYAQIVIMYLTLFGVMGVLYVFLVLETRIRFLARFVAFCAVIGGVGFVVGSPQILPALQFAPLTRRGGGLDYALASLKAIRPGELILFLFPDYTYFPYLSVGRKALYVGAAWFLLAAGMARIAVHEFSKRSVRTREACVFAMVFLLSLATAFVHSPIFYLLQHLPVFNLFRFSDRWMYGGIFFLAMLGGYGFDVLTALPIQKYLRRFYTLLSLPITAFLALIAGLNVATSGMLKSLAAFFTQIFNRALYGHGPFTKDPSHYEEAMVRGLDAWKEFVSLQHASFLVPVAILVSGMILIWLFLYQKISTAVFKGAITCLMLITAVTLVSFQFSNTLSRTSIAEIEAHSFLQFIPQSDREMYRYYPFMPDAGYRTLVPPTYQLTAEEIRALVELGFGTGWPNTNISYEMPSVDGYDVFVTRDYIDTLALAGSTFGAQDYTRTSPLEEKTQRLKDHLDVLGMMGGKYVVSGVVLTSPHAVLLGSYPVTKWDIPIYVYRNALALPRVYIASTTIDAPERSLPQLLLENKRDFIRQTYLGCSGCARNGDATVEAQEFKNGDNTIVVNARTSSWLVLSETYVPGWRATVDGVSAEMVRANGMYMAVQVPEGSHTVNFRYYGNSSL